MADSPFVDSGVAVAAPAFRDPVPPTIVDKAHHVEVIGMSAREVARALELLSQARRLQAEATTALAAGLLQLMTAAGEPLASPAQVEQTQRRVALRQRLLQGGYETFGSLAELRGAVEGTARQWATRERDAGRILSVKTGGRTILPSFQFDDDGAVIPASAAAVSTLRSAGLDGWQLWAWMCSPSSWVDGDVPADLLVDEPAAVEHAASEYAGELRPGYTAATKAASGEKAAMKAIAKKAAAKKPTAKKTATKSTAKKAVTKTVAKAATAKKAAKRARPRSS